MNSTQISIFKNTYHACFRGFLGSEEGSRLEPQIILHILGNIANKALELLSPEQQNEIELLQQGIAFMKPFLANTIRYMQKCSASFLFLRNSTLSTQVTSSYQTEPLPLSVALIATLDFKDTIPMFWCIMHVPSATMFS
jgi:hypothetical protein